jgi:hypothetical protein
MYEAAKKIQILIGSGDISMEEAHTIIASVLFVQDLLKTEINQTPELSTENREILTNLFTAKYGQMALRNILK